MLLMPNILRHFDNPTTMYDSYWYLYKLHLEPAYVHVCMSIVTYNIRGFVVCIIYHYPPGHQITEILGGSNISWVSRASDFTDFIIFTDFFTDF